MVETEFAELMAPWPEAMLLIDGSGQVLASNEAMTIMSGVSKEALTGKKLQDFVADEPARVGAYLRACARSRSLTPGSLTWLLTDGQTVSNRCEGALLRPKSADSEAVLIVRCLPKAEASKQFIALNEQLESLKRQYQAQTEQTAILERRVAERTDYLQEANDQLEQEIIERKQAELALQRSQNRISGILDIANEAIISIDEAQNIILFNKGAEQIFGHAAKDLMGQPLEILLPDQFKAAHQDHIVQFSQSPETARIMGKRSEVFGQRKNGEIFPAEASISKLQETDGTIFTVVLRDITERKETEQAIERINQELTSQAADLAEVNTELSQYAYVVSHDIRAPLRAIHNYADFLREDLDGTLEDEQGAYLNGLNVAVQEAEALVEDLLSLSRVGRQKLSIEQVDLSKFLTHLIQSLHLPMESEVTLTEHWPTLETGPTLLRQIFQNLILNGLKFNQASSKQVELGWQQIEEANQDFYEIFVRDNGIGIAPEYQERIFQVFERLHTRHEFEGTGIGLAIVRKAVNRLGGAVRLESQVGSGTTFFVTLPVTTPVF